MNLAVYFYTLLVKIRSLPVISSLLFFAGALPITLGMLTRYGDEHSAAQAALAIFSSAAIPMVICYIVQRDAFADSRIMSDGEYLALLFTRPVSRGEYVFSKWLAAATFAAGALLVQLVVYHTIVIVMGGHADYLWTPYRAMDIVLQSLSAAAVVSLINAVPRRLGSYLFSILSCASLLVQTPATEARHGSFFPAGGTPFDFFCMLINSVLSNRINSYDLLLSSHPDWLAGIAFLSNITIYLLVSIYLLNRREFFYASE